MFTRERGDLAEVPRGKKILIAPLGKIAKRPDIILGVIDFRAWVSNIKEKMQRNG